MKKHLFTALVATALLGGAVSVQAATVTQAFDVSVTLNAVCRVVTATATPTPKLDFGTYTAFGSASVAAPTASFDIECTRNLVAPTFSYDGGTSYGVISGLNYNVTTTSAIKTTGGAATAVAGGIGGADVRTVTLTGSMDANQAGSCGGATETACKALPAVANRTLTIIY